MTRTTMAPSLMRAKVEPATMYLQVITEKTIKQISSWPEMELEESLRKL